MTLAEHPVIMDLADTDPGLLQLFSPLERAVLETCKEIVESRQAGT